MKALPLLKRLPLQSISAIHTKPVRLNLSPFEVAAKCRHLPGLVFFDSALETDDAISIVAAAPGEICTGREWEALAQKVAARQRTDFDRGFPVGIAAGFVDYDG